MRIIMQKDEPGWHASCPFSILRYRDGIGLNFPKNSLRGSRLFQAEFFSVYKVNSKTQHGGKNDLFPVDFDLCDCGNHLLHIWLLSWLSQSKQAFCQNTFRSQHLSFAEFL